MNNIPEFPLHYPILIVSPNANLDSYYMMEQIQVNAVNRAHVAVHTAGGKGNNMARAARSLGGNILSLGMVGGTSGQYIRQELEREGIPHELVWTKNETRRSSTLIDTRLLQTTVVLDAGEPVELENGRELIARTRQYAKQAKYLVLIGSLPHGLPTSYYADFIHAVADFPQLKICLDCSGEVLKKATEARAHVIKINAQEFYGSFLEHEAFELSQVLAVFHRLENQGLELLIITNGSKGAYIFPSQKPPFLVNTRVDTLVTTVGAGDTFLAGLLLKLLDDRDIEEAACFASAAAAANLQNIVCGSLTQEDVRDFLALTECIPLSKSMEMG